MVPIGIFVAVTGVSLILLRTLSGTPYSHGRLRRRLTDEFTAGPANTLSPLYKNLDALQATDADAGRVRPTRRSRWQTGLDEFLRQAGVPVDAQRLLIGTGIVAGVFGLLAFLFSGPLMAAAAVLVAGGTPFLLLNVRRKVRREKYLKQLVGALELMARVMRAGQSVTEAFRAAVDAFDDPLAGEFGRCLHQIEHGLRPEAAFRELSQRAGVLELQLFVVATTVQRQSGGNLSEILDRLAAMIRTRLKLRQKIRALTAEGRLQSLTLMVLPVLTFGVMYVLNRSYAELLLVQWRLLLVAVGCMLIGALWIRNIMKFEG